ncbi:hypothetical protein MAP00_004949 [Monascus purpureus]|nr:hypothetical protein MAP00_004949 [Monascus purpureus]
MSLNRLLSPLRFLFSSSFCTRVLLLFLDTTYSCSFEKWIYYCFFFQLLSLAVTEPFLVLFLSTVGGYNSLKHYKWAGGFIYISFRDRACDILYGQPQTSSPFPAITHSKGW